MKYLFVILWSIVFVEANGQVNEPKPFNEAWAKPYESFRIVGNVYYVGTYDLACYLITTPVGHILINTGLAASASLIEKNVAALGFKFSEIKILLTTQVHWDHCGALAAIKSKTGAQMMVNREDAKCLEDGGQSDFAFGGKGSLFAPVKADRQLNPNDKISLGDVELTMLHHPGHTKGSCSYLFKTKDSKRSYQVLIANLPTIVVEGRLSEIKSYPGISEDIRTTLESMERIAFDIWLASHASQFKLHEKRKPGSLYNPTAFIDRSGYEIELAKIQNDFKAREKQE